MMGSSIRPADYWIKQLELKPHPEGGYFREVYRASEQIPAHGLPSRFSGARAMATSIFYLLQAGEYSAFHRIRSDETWHFYEGQPLEVHQLHSVPQGCEHRVTVLGREIQAGQCLQWTVPAGVWFASRPSEPDKSSSLPHRAYSLVGCTVSPGFDFADFELARREELIRQFPTQSALIRELTPPNSI